MFLRLRKVLNVKYVMHVMNVCLSIWESGQFDSAQSNFCLELVEIFKEIYMLYIYLKCIIVDLVEQLV